MRMGLCCAALAVLLLGLLMMGFGLSENSPWQIVAGSAGVAIFAISGFASHGWKDDVEGPRRLVAELPFALIALGLVGGLVGLAGMLVLFVVRVTVLGGAFVLLLVVGLLGLAFLNLKVHGTSFIESPWQTGIRDRGIWTIFGKGHR